MNKSILLLLTVVVVLSLAGCGKKTFTTEAVSADVDKCATCSMQVADDRNATEIVLKEGKALKFDDIGCMYDWTKKNGLETVGAQFVRDYNSKEWVKLEDATFVYDKMNKTPMAYGIFSFKDKASAEAFVADQGKGQLLAAADLNAHVWERNKEMMKEIMKTNGMMNNNGTTENTDMMKK